MGLLTGKKALIVGVASQRSIAWGIAEAMYREGAELVFTYQNERLQTRVAQIAAQCGNAPLYPLDVASDTQIATLANQVKEDLGSLDILVHSVGFAPREALTGRFTENVSREAWSIAQDISAYSLTALSRAFAPLMPAQDAAILTLSYLGATRAMPNYNIMGPAKAALESSVRYLAADLGPDNIRVNAISAGPIKTLAAAGVSGFREMLTQNAATAPLRRNVTIEEVGNVAAFLCSPYASGITGEITHVDAGYNIAGML